MHMRSKRSLWQNYLGIPSPKIPAMQIATSCSCFSYSWTGMKSCQNSFARSPAPLLFIRKIRSCSLVAWWLLAGAQWSGVSGRWSVAGGPSALYPLSPAPCLLTPSPVPCLLSPPSSVLRPPPLTWTLDIVLLDIGYCSPPRRWSLAGPRLPRRQAIRPPRPCAVGVMSGRPPRPCAVGESGPSFVPAPALRLLPVNGLEKIPKNGR